jgi:hypothetical protein
MNRLPQQNIRTHTKHNIQLVKHQLFTTEYIFLKMGNRSSTNVDNTRATQINDQPQLDESSSQVTMVTSSGVFLSNELQGT